VHALAAAFRAVNDLIEGRLRSRNVHSEVVFALSPNNNVSLLGLRLNRFFRALFTIIPLSVVIWLSFLVLFLSFLSPPYLVCLEIYSYWIILLPTSFRPLKPMFVILWC